MYDYMDLNPYYRNMTNQIVPMPLPNMVTQNSPNYPMQAMEPSMDVPKPMTMQQGMSVSPSTAVLPTGTPMGPAIGPVPGADIVTGSITPETLQSPEYLAGYLRRQIGKKVRVEFLIGSSGPLVDRVGTLVGVGASYILIQPVETDDVLLCDLYSIKFVTFLL